MRVSTMLALGLALSAPACVSIDLLQIDEEGRMLRSGSLTDGPRADAFDIGLTTLDEVLERLGVPPDELRESAGSTVAIWHTRHVFVEGWTGEMPLVEGQEVEFQVVDEYFLECTFDAQGVLVSCTEFGLMPDPAGEWGTCGAEDCDA